MDLTETSKTPVTDSNAETIMVSENVKQCFCSKNNEKNEAHCCKRSPVECCSTQCNIKMEDPVAKTCLESPRKCVDICQHGCCVTIRCGGERKIICLRIICSGKVTCSETCGEPLSGEDSKNRCDVGDCASKNFCSITSNSKTEVTESGPAGDGEASCMNSKKCFKSIGSSSEDGNARMTNENVKPDCEDTKCSCCKVGSASGQIDFDKCCTREKASSSFDDDVTKNAICKNRSAADGKTNCCNNNQHVEDGSPIKGRNCPTAYSGEDITEKTVGVSTQDRLCCGDGCISAKKTKPCKLEVQCCCSKEQCCCNTIQSAQDESQMKMCYCQTACSGDNKILCCCHDKNGFSCCQSMEPCYRTSNNIETASQTPKMCCCIVTNSKKCADTCSIGCCKVVIKCWCERSEGCGWCSCSRDDGVICGKNCCCTSTSEDITRNNATPQEFLCSGKCKAECPTNCGGYNNTCCCDKITGCLSVSVNVGCCIVIIQTRRECCNCMKTCTQTSGQIQTADQIPKSCCCSSDSSTEKGCTCDKVSYSTSASGEDITKKTVGVPTQNRLCCGDGCISAKETKHCKVEVQCCCTKEQCCRTTIQSTQDESQMKICYCQTASSGDNKILCCCHDKNGFSCCQSKEPCYRTSNNIETASQTPKMCCCIVTNSKKCADTCTIGCCKVVIKSWCERSEGCGRCSCSRDDGAICGKNCCRAGMSEDIIRKNATPQEFLCSGKCKAECSKLE